MTEAQELAQLREIIRAHSIFGGDRWEIVDMLEGSPDRMATITPQRALRELSSRVRRYSWDRQALFQDEVEGMHSEAYWKVVGGFSPYCYDKAAMNYGGTVTFDIGGFRGGIPVFPPHESPFASAADLARALRQAHARHLPHFNTDAFFRRPRVIVVTHGDLTEKMTPADAAALTGMRRELPPLLAATGWDYRSVRTWALQFDHVLTENCLYWSVGSEGMMKRHGTVHPAMSPIEEALDALVCDALGRAVYRAQPDEVAFCVYVNLAPDTPTALDLAAKAGGQAYPSDPMLAGAARAMLEVSEALGVTPQTHGNGFAIPVTEDALRPRAVAAIVRAHGEAYSYLPFELGWNAVSSALEVSYPTAPTMRETLTEGSFRSALVQFRRYVRGEALDPMLPDPLGLAGLPGTSGLRERLAATARPQRDVCIDFFPMTRKAAIVRAAERIRVDAVGHIAILSKGSLSDGPLLSKMTPLAHPMLLSKKPTDALDALREDGHEVQDALAPCVAADSKRLMETLRWWAARGPAPGAEAAALP